MRALSIFGSNRGGGGCFPGMKLLIFWSPAKTMATVTTSFLMFLSLFAGLRHLNPEGILFYQGVALGICVSLAQFSYDLLRKRASISEASKNAFLTFLQVYCFVITIPTTVDHSYTVKMIGWISDALAGLGRDEIGDQFVTVFISNGGVERRLREQSATGTVVERNRRYVLTTERRLMQRAFQLARWIFTCAFSYVDGL